MFPLDAAMEQVRELARSHLRMLGLLEHSPTDIASIIKAFDVHLISEPCWAEPDWDGMAIETEGGYRAILVNSFIPPARRAFTIAHELGHLVMEHRPPRSKEQESLADAYASELLMPYDRIVRQIQDFGQNVTYLAGLNGVSYRAMGRRLQELSAMFVERFVPFLMAVCFLCGAYQALL